MLQALLELLFPNICPGCEERFTPRGHAICTLCHFELPFTDQAVLTENSMTERFWGIIPIRHASALLFYEKSTLAQTLIHELKYRNGLRLGRELGRIMGQKLKQSGRYHQVQAVIPIPLHWRKQWTRGYNQCEVFGQPLAHELGVPLLTHVLKRRRFTKTQARLTGTERQQNMSGAFQIKTNVTGMHILLIDDVMTTGATLVEAATALHEAGAIVSIGVLAQALN